jgi:hypothetical protein
MANQVLTFNAMIFKHVLACTDIAFSLRNFGKAGVRGLDPYPVGQSFVRAAGWT